MEGARERQCIGKVKLLTQESADLQAKFLHKKFKARYTGYKCPHCGFFHTGTNRSREAATRRTEKRLAAKA